MWMIKTFSAQIVFKEGYWFNIISKHRIELIKELLVSKHTLEILLSPRNNFSFDEFKIVKRD